MCRVSERGLASWYGRKFHGRRTASGEVYDMYAMTAAHPTLPIPSYARIRNPANGREVLVRVNDRGPFVAGRIVDLSYAAALKLDLLRGVAPVELERITFDEIRTGAWRGGACASRRRRWLRRPGAGRRAAADAPRRRRMATTRCRRRTSPRAAPSVAAARCRRRRRRADARRRPGRAPAEAARGFWVQLGAFRERDGAETFRRRVGADGESAWLEPLLAIFGDASLYRVQAGPYPSRDEAERRRAARAARRARRRADRRRAAMSTARHVIGDPARFTFDLTPALSRRREREPLPLPR